MNKKSDFYIAITEKDNRPLLNSNIHLKNQYSFEIGNVHISIKYSDNIVFAQSADENLIILLSGNIYQDDLFGNSSTEEYLLDKYSIYKKDFVKNLNGSFCLFFVQKDSSEIYFATNRLNTRKIYKFDNARKLVFATDINYLPLHECTLSYSGISSYLMTGSIYNNLTVFEEINKLNRASLHKVVDFKIISEQYWDYQLTNEYSDKSELDLTHELHHLYLKSLNRLITNKKNILLSLSGGYDSRVIAGMLSEKKTKDHNIICFSHNFAEDTKDTDSEIAREVAEKLGFQFKLYISYAGSPLNVFKNNAKLGKCTARFCDEIDAWKQIECDFGEVEDSILIVGDMYDGTFDEFHGNTKRALEKIHICESSYLKPFKKYFDIAVFRNLSEHWDIEYDKILKKFYQQDNLVDYLDYIDKDQSIPNVFSMARECFQMPFIETATPYYDNEVLDFVRKLPSDLRIRKKLHVKTLEMKYPELSEIKLPSKDWGKAPVWVNEIKSHSNIFIDDIKNSKSRFDEIIPPDNIISTILNLNNSEQNKDDKSYLKSLHNSIKKIFPYYHKIIEIFPGGKELTRKAGKYVKPRILNPLIRILVLRSFLIN